MDFDLETIKKLPIHEQKEILKLLDLYQKAENKEKARKKYLDYVRYIWPDSIIGRHHKELAKIYDGIIRRELKRVIINLPPRHTKSEYASWLFPTFFLGQRPEMKIMQVCNIADLAEGFGRKVRDTIWSEEYQELFPDTSVSRDARAAKRWTTTKGGTYYATGVGGALAGRGADHLTVDDPHTEAEAERAAFDPKCFDATWEWYNVGPRQRLQPNGSIAIVATRWGKKDLPGRAIQQAIDTGSINEWKIFSFPAIMPSGKPLWPEYWSEEELLKVKRDIPVSRWNAQYQQNPTAEEGALIKREWWKPWEKSNLPEMEFIVQSWDTAFTKTNHSDYSACTTWGVFKVRTPEGRLLPQVMLLDVWQDRVEFPRLKDQARIQFQEWGPDAVVVEGRASGQPLIFELRALGMPISEFMPARGNDKLARVNAISDMFSSGFVWFKPSKMAEHVIEQFASFPYGDHDDLVDSSTQALLRLREGLLVGARHDSIDLSEDEEDRPTRRRDRRFY